MLAGKANTVSASMKALEDARERALVVGFSLIILPDMTRYAGDGAGIKAITGGDKVAIDRNTKRHTQRVFRRLCWRLTTAPCHSVTAAGGSHVVV